MSDTEIGAALEILWGTAAVNTRNARRTLRRKMLHRCLHFVGGHTAQGGGHQRSGPA
ncbi:hypothetical protein [Nocardia sp. CA-119907]|uniref:hypothetical protein n=1 Tax=Nocardia sp. CA-119907 TaxID=3239973 RepID=UPI003D964F18